MATDLENVTARKTAVLLELASLSRSMSGGKPNINGGGAGTVDHVGYKASLYAELRELDLQITMLQGPFEVPLEGRVA
jgi:hypothetical protein